MRLAEDESIARKKERRRKMAEKNEVKREKKELQHIIALVLAEAQRLEMGAAHMGARDDGGAGRLEEQAKFFRAGLRGEIPEEWKKYELRADPEYAEWQRLNKKFGGKV